MLMNFSGAFSFGYGNRSILSPNQVQTISKQDVPGPGTYDQLKNQKKSSPKWTIRQKNKTDSCFAIKQDLPAPGQYQLQPASKTTISIQKKKQFSLSNEKSKNIQRYTSSGNNLNIPTSIKSNIGHQFGYKFQQKILDFSPGPTYNINQIRDFQKKTKKQSSNGFGFGNRDAIYRNFDKNIPGPGSYKENQTADKKGRVVFSKGDRNYLSNKQNQQLGPGSYDPKIVQFDKGCKFKAKYKQIKCDGMQNVGPGAYKIPQIKSPTSVKFVQNKTQSLKKLDKLQSPSPFNYNPKRFPEAYKSNQGYRMGYAQRNSSGQQQITPGPGQYQIPRDLDKHGVIIATKLKNIQKRQSKLQKEEDSSYTTPKYDLVIQKSPAFSFPTENSNKNQQIQNPIGPGTYNPKLIGTSQKYSMGKMARFKQQQKQELPYFIPKVESTIGNIPQYLLNGRK